MIFLRRTFLFLVFGLASFHAFSQSATIFGTVLDSLRKPLYGVSVSVFGEAVATTTDDKGIYMLPVASNKEQKIVFSFTGLQGDTVRVNLFSGERKELNKTLFGRISLIREVKVEDQSLKTTNVTRINPKIVSVIPTPNQSVEDLLKTLPGVSSANELSSTYSVRGGNFDENLVYVNDIEVYRPFLVRSGQQEGLSFKSIQ